jgi:hypothetical protein
MHRLNAKTAQLTDFSGSMNRVRFDHRFAHPNEPVAKSLWTHALWRHVRALEQQKQLICQHFRLS